MTIGLKEKRQRIYNVVPHFRLPNGIVRELLEAGNKTDDIILAYNAPPYQR